MTLEFFWWRSLKTRVTLCMLAIFLVGIWSLAFYASRMLRGDMQRELGEQQFSIASILASQVNDELVIRIGALEKTAARITPAILANTAGIQTRLDESPALLELFNGGVVAIGPEGTAIAEVPHSIGVIGVNLMDRDHIVGALKEGKATIGRPVIGKKLPTPIVAIAVPIRDPQGKVLGALSGLTDLGKPNFLDQLTGGSYGKTGGYFLVAPRPRLIVTASDKTRVMEAYPISGTSPLIERRLQGHEGTDVFVNPRGVEVLDSAKNIPVAGWYVSVALPTEEAFAPIGAMQQRMLLAAFILTLLAGGLTWWMLRRQLAPMLATARTLASLSDANQRPQSLPVARQDEVGDLISGFNRLLKTLAQREEALKESEGRYRTLVEGSREAIAVHRGGKLIYVNPTAINMIGATSAQDLVGKPFLDFIHPDSRQIVLARVKNAADHRVAAPMIEETFLKLDGTAIDVEVQSTPIAYDGEPAIQVAMRDITERKRVDRVLLESGKRHRLLFESSRDALMTLAPPSWRFTDANQATVELFRAASVLAFTEHDPQDVSPERQPDGRLSDEKAQEAIATAMREGEFAFEWEHQRLDGSRFPADVLLTRMDLAGEVFLQATVRDITEQKRAQGQLRAREEQFRGLVEQHITGIYIIQNGVFVYVNPRFAEIFGYEPRDITGMQVSALVAERDRGLVLENMRKRFSGEITSVEYEFTGQRRNGTLVDIGVHGTTSVHNGKPAIIGVLQDISGKKRAEEEIRHYIEQLKTAFMSTVEVAMTMGEMRDPYTVGHERRVADLAVAIGAELGFDARRQEGLLVAGRLHDIGKFAVPAEILSKPGKLTAIEFQLIQGHAQASYDVLKAVEFPWPVAQVALQHHERMDGSGYPQSLKGDAILLEARIMAVADVVEAMSSHRPYRPGLGVDKALAEIERGRGTTYDLNVADACLKLFREKNHTLLA